MDPAVGIDLGTTYSVVAYINPDGRPQVISNAERKATTPSVVYLGEDPPSVGDAAKERQALGEEAVASFFKRGMGDPDFLLHHGGRDWTPVDLSALVLAKLKRDAEDFLRRPVTRAVITVPAYFAEAQRNATLEAGRRAGLDVLRIINEPTAAALAFGLHKTGSAERLLVYDLGGGTFDVSLVAIDPQEIRVVATAGDHNLGGKDWDDRVAGYAARRFEEAHGFDPLDDQVAVNDVLVRCEKAKKELSDRQATQVVLHHGGVKQAVPLDRTTFDELTRDLMERTQALCEQVLREAGLTWESLTGVLLVGGSTRMPIVHDYVRRMSGKPPMTGVNVDEAVALGAAVQAALVLAEETPGGTAGLFLPGKRLVVDVIPHTLGVIAESGDRSRFLNSPIVPRNTPLPAQGKKEYQAAVRGDGSVECTVYVTQGDSDDPRQVSVPHKYLCRGKAAQGGGRATIEVAYGYDKNATIQVRARTVGGAPLEILEQPVGDLSWLARSPRDLDSFDPSKLRLVVTPPHYDDIGAILTGLGLPFRPFTGATEGDILFLNCGTPRFPPPRALRGFVEAGGCLYASDQTDVLVAEAFPGVFSFAGHAGQAGTHVADVVDPELRTALKSERINVSFDMPAWAVLDSVGREVRVLLRSRETGRPLMGVASVGKGTVFYTCFHNHHQANDTEQSLLQLLVLKQISAVSGLPIEVVSKSKGLTLNF